jgi:hypothetical protein
MRRGGNAFSLAETAVAAALSAVLLMAVYRLLISGVERGEEMTEEHRLMSDVRGLFENMSLDIASAHVILPVPGGEDAWRTSLALARYAGEDVGVRLEANRGNPDYPFFGDPTIPTVVRLPSRRVRYLLDPFRKEISRVEEYGMLEGHGSYGASAVGDFRLVGEYEFRPEGERPGRVMARNVQKFDLFYLDYDDRGQPRLVTTASDLHRAACVGVHIVAAQVSGLYAWKAGRPASRRQPVVEMATKFWIARRLSEAAYPEYFSSVDEDLSY